jgi:hypothetical protein
MVDNGPQHTGRGSRSLFGQPQGRPPSSLDCRQSPKSNPAWKLHPAKLTVFVAAANRSFVFRWRSFAMLGDPRSCWEGPGFARPRRSARVCWGGRGLTRARLISTLKQSPESRRYGCDPEQAPGDRAGQQARTPPTDESPSISGRMVSQTQRGERRGQGQADLPAEQPASSPCSRFPVADAHPCGAGHRHRSAS